MYLYFRFITGGKNVEDIQFTRHFLILNINITRIYKNTQTEKENKIRDAYGQAYKYKYTYAYLYAKAHINACI